MNKVIGFIIGLVSLPLSAASCDEAGAKIGLVGLDNPNGTIYAQILDDNKKCGCDYARFMPGNTDVDKAIGVLLAAKLADKTVRIDFATSGNCNTGYKVFIQ